MIVAAKANAVTAAAVFHGQYGIWDELIPSLVVLAVVCGFLYLNFKLAYKNTAVSED